MTITWDDVWTVVLFVLGIGLFARLLREVFE